MDKQELIQAIKDGFARGKRKNELHEELTKVGWTDREIDEAIFSIQKEALKQLPGFSHFFNWFDDPVVHAKLMNPRVQLTIFLSLLGGLIISVFIFNYFFDPFSVNAGKRDIERSSALEELRSKLQDYYIANDAYPSSLTDLTPQYLKKVPTDPKTQEAYKYTLEDGGLNYQLCIDFEVERSQCIYAQPMESIKATTPTIAPTN